MNRSPLQKTVSFLVALAMVFQIFVLPFSQPVSAAVPGELAESNSPATEAQEETAASYASAPPALANPISVSRVQSVYQVGDSLTITYTVTNNRPPTLFPEVPLGATITETVESTADFDNGNDPNTLRNVLLISELTGAAAYGEAMPTPDRDHRRLAWQLGDIPPLTSKSAALTVNVMAADFATLDSGASVWGTLQGRAVSASTAPAAVVPLDFSQWLVWTPDADIYDNVMLAQAAELGQEATALFEFVRGMGYEAYEGSLRGTRGTIWSGAGNSVDQASLLIAMLRAAGIPARYRHGTLATEEAETLIESMFPRPTRYAGQTPGGDYISDPVHDRELLAEATDHWWVEAYLPDQGWRDLDPSFVTATIGDSFATPAADGSDRIAELPDAMRHKITLRLKVEDYHPLNLGPGNLDYTYPFEQTLNVVEVAGQPVSFAQIVHTENQGGLAFGNIIHTYTPYLLIGENEVYGDSYQEFLTNFPLGTKLLTGAWMEIDLLTPDGTSESYERVVKDRIGYENRIHGGTADFALGGNDSAFFTDMDILSFGFWPAFVPEGARQQAQASALADMAVTNADSRRLLELREQESLSVAEQDELRAIRIRLQLNLSRFLSNITLSFAETADRMAQDTGATGFVKGYYDAPRLIIAGNTALDEEDSILSLDLRRTTIRAIAYPGQDERAAVGFNIARGVVESGIEGAVLEYITGQPAATTARLFEAAAEQEVYPVAIDAGNLFTLNDLTISEEAKARITAAALEGKLIIVPHSPVLLNGQEHSGWWQMDAETGETIGVMDNGLHLAALEYIGSLAADMMSDGMVDFMLGFTSYALGFVTHHVDKAIGEGTFDLDNYLSTVGNAGTGLTCISAIAAGFFDGAISAATSYGGLSCGGGVVGAATGYTLDFFGAGQKAAEAYLSSLVQGDPPLPDNWVAHPDRSNPISEVSEQVAATASYNSGPFSANLQSSSLLLSGALESEWTAAAGNNYPFNTLTVSEGDLYGENGSLIGSGALSAGAAGATPATVSVQATAAVSGEGRVAAYAPAVAGLGASAAWQTHTTQLDSDQSYALSLRNAAVTLDGIRYEGNFTIETEAPVFLQGAGDGAAALFAANATLGASDGRLITGPATGVVSAGGTAVGVSNGLALAGFDHSLTISEVDANRDQITFSDDSVDFFTLNLSQPNSHSDPQTPVFFQAQIEANFSDTYTVTASAAQGWDVTLSATGHIVARPPAGAAPGDHAILVTAQSNLYPDLVVSAVHTVTIGQFDGLQMSVQPDPVYTVPMGPVRNTQPLAPADTNSGQAQVPGAAYTINITNTANAPRTITLDIDGLPNGWTLLGNNSLGATQTSLTLDAGEVGQLGLAIAADVLPVAGQIYPFTVSAQSDSGVSANDSAIFTMPAVPFSMLLSDPVVVYTGPNSTATADLTLTNVGNAAGSFPLSYRAIAPAVTVDGVLDSPIELAPDEMHTQSVTLTVGDAIVGRSYPVYFDSPIAGSVYTQTTAVFVHVVSEIAHDIYLAISSTCLQSEPEVLAALETLASSVINLETACGSGDCPAVLRDQVVNALEGVADYAANVSPLITAHGALQTIAADLAAAEDDAAILSTLAAIAPAITALDGQLCEVKEHQVAVSWTPAYGAALPGQPLTYTLNVKNEGTVETTYAITVDLPSGQTLLNETIAAGSSASFDMEVSETGLGRYRLYAEAVPEGPDVTLDGIRDSANAGYNVVDRFLQVMSVTADPDFVETGDSTTSLRVAVANVANTLREVTARTTVTAPNSSASFEQDIPLTLLTGAPRTYDLADVNTSGWAEGVYTITVELLDGDETPFEGGYGYGIFSVGQAVHAGHSVSPSVVAPGTSIVTTTITTGSNLAVEEEEENGPESGGNSYSIYDAPFWNVEEVSDNELAHTGEGMTGAEGPSASGPNVVRPNSEAMELEGGQLEEEDAGIPMSNFELAEEISVGEEESDDGERAPEVEAAPFSAMQPAATSIGAFTRYEQDDPAITLTGNWNNYNLNQASGGSYLRSWTAGDSAILDFSGSWLNIGFIGSHQSGQVEIDIDGESQGIFDLYRSEINQPISFVFPDLENTTHTVTITVQSEHNPFSINRYVQLDYIDAWDGQPLGDGFYEQDNLRVLLSNGWSNVDDNTASGGSYVRSTTATAWFPFHGDSFSYQAFSYSTGGRANLYVDGQYLDTVDLYNASSTTRTFSYEGLGDGPHLLQISTYRGLATIDLLSTPGQAPFTDPNPPQTGITRLEEDHPSILYNDLPRTVTARSWTRADASRASDGQMIYSATAGDTISLDFEGVWVGVGFVTDRFGGKAEIAIDGMAVAEADLYTRFEDTASYYFDELTPGAHTLTITVLGERHPNALNQRVYFDYIDLWDGEPLAEGTFEETDARLFISSGWSYYSDAAASGGGFASSGNSDSTVWFPFTGDSVTAQLWTARTYEQVDIKIDGVSQGLFNISQVNGGPRPFSFDGLGEGAHVLEVRKFRSAITLDAFITPTTGEHYEPPSEIGVIRLEEYHPDLRYNGYPYRQMPGSWNSESTLNNSSDRTNATTSTAGNTLSLDFEGPWVGVGFRSSSGVAEIFIDGVSWAEHNTSGGAGGVNSIYFDDLEPGNHTISVTVVSGAVKPDFIDIWDGQAIDDGWYDADMDNPGRFAFSNKSWWGEYEHQYAHDGDYVAQNLVNANPNMWFTFVGNDLTVLGFTRNGSTLDIAIDGQSYGSFDMSSDYSDQPHALHFGDLGHGPHSVRVHTSGNARVDAFEVNPDGFYNYVPEIIWHDDSAKEVLDSRFGTGFLSSVALGDINNDGVVELVAPGVNGRLYVYRGDGADTGDGTPILWTSDLVGPAAEPALADLTGDGNAEIIVSGYYGTFAFHHDGTLLWEQDVVKSIYTQGSYIYGWGGPSIANLDDDLNPEIVISAANDAIYVLDHEGNILASEPLEPGDHPTVPVLADITGDGTLDIVVANNHTLFVYEYDATAGLTEAWSYTLDPSERTASSGTYGAPAVADINGDGQPELIINWGHRIEALDANGARLWSYYTGNDNHYKPSPVTVADATGGGQMNLITASAVRNGSWVNGHNLMVLRADGTLVWEQIVNDTTPSASGVAAQDLDGDGIWEILWNGDGDGFMIMRGSDGKRLFREPFTASGTIMDYPALGDVDGDGIADVVTAGREGIFVISHVGRWIDSRPMWNQHNYHVTNINDDWSVPLNEPDSWAVHNTYRTQTPQRDPAPSYRVEVTHTVGLDGVTVLPGSFSSQPGGTPPLYYWEYQLQAHTPDSEITFQSELADMRPGETRQVNQGTEIAYRLPSGWNWLELPPLYVSASHIIEIDPLSQAMGAGGVTTYDVTLTNPAGAADVYTLTVSGLPDEWVSLPEPVEIAANDSVTVALQVTAPEDAGTDLWPFAVVVENESGGVDQAGALLEVIDALDISVSPIQQTATVGEVVTYTLTVTNHEDVERTYDLWAAGMADLSIPAQVTVPANDSAGLEIQASAAQSGPQPFTVYAGGPAADSASAVLVATGNWNVNLALNPDPAVTGPGATALLDLTVTNLGDTADSYELALELPDGWSYTLDANGAEASTVTIPPQVFNSARLDLALTPPLDAPAGEYIITATATSLAQPALVASASGTVEVLERGVQVEIEPASSILHPTASGTWQVKVTNTGSIASSYWLTATGIVGPSGEFATNPVALDPGQSTTVAFSAGPFDFALPTTYPFSIAATAQEDERIHAEDTAAITFETYEAVEVAWQPPSQSVVDTLSATFLLVITNTSNVPTTYDLDLDAPNLRGELPLDSITLPAKSVALLPLTVEANGPGVHTFNGSATAAQTNDEDAATLIIEYTSEPPIVDAGPDQTVNEGDEVVFSGSGNDPDGGALSIHWDFGDGGTVSGVFSPRHTYLDDGNYLVTLTVSNEAGLSTTDTLWVTVENVAPIVNAGLDQTVNGGDVVQFSGSFSDPGVLDTHTIQWQFGNAGSASHTLTPTFIFGEPGVYEVTLTVTDDDGGVGNDTLTVTVESTGYNIILPIIHRE